MPDADGQALVGRLNNWPVYVHLNPDAIGRFHVDDIFHCERADRDDDPRSIKA